MNQGLAVILPMLFFTLLDLIIVYNVYKYKYSASTRTIFLFMTISTFVQQLCGMISYLFDYQITPAPSAVQYVVYLCLFTAMAFTSFEWFMYLSMLLIGKQDLSKGIKILLSFPVVVIFCLTVVSPWTHWILWISADGIYQRGEWYFLQFVCGYIYVVFAIVVLIFCRKRSASVYWKKVYSNFILFTFPALLGTLLQLKVFPGGYTMIGISIAVLFIYLNLYMDEINENQRLQLAEQEQTQHLQEVTRLNSSLEKQKEELHEQIDTIGGLSNAYLVVYSFNKETKEFFAVKEIEEAHELLEGCHTIDEAFDRFLPVEVASENLSSMKEFTDSETLSERLKNRDTISIEFRKKLPVKGWNRASWIVANRDEHGNAYKFLYIVEEITDSVLERKRQETNLKQARDQAEAANAAKTSFLFNMSHDIRTPMNAIIGFRDLLEKYQDDSGKRQDYLNKIQDASTVLLSIINNVLEMARIEKGALEIDETVWSVEQFFDTVYSVFYMMMKEKGLKFTRRIEVKHHYTYCDPTKLREIFINILSNAYKYTNSGGSVNLLLEEIPSDREGWTLYRTTISDTGIGMSEEFLPHIFEEFSREQNTTDAKVEGTGLGMSIVKRLVEMLEGTIEVESEKGKGSTFIVTIPHKITDKTTLEHHADVQIDPKIFKDKHILLVEDNNLNAEIAMEILGEAGFIVDRAEDGKVCIDMLKKEKSDYYDLILMDIQMPNMNGYEATRAIRQFADHEKANIKILAMTANAFEEDKREALRVGMNGHLAKPINVNELMKTLAKMLV